MIKKFTIYGERCSGTNFLEEAIRANFDVEITWDYGWKHFFGNYEFKGVGDTEEDETLFIGIVRHPVKWLDSFFNTPHHVPPQNKQNIRDFLFKPFYSIMENGQINDLNYKTKKPYKNIFELRQFKNDYLINVMPTKVKHYILINYEDLLHNYVVKMNEIKDKFELLTLCNVIKDIPYYKKNKKDKFVLKQTIGFTPAIVTAISNNVDKEQEKSLSYVI